MALKLIASMPEIREYYRRHQDRDLTRNTWVPGEGFDCRVGMSCANCPFHNSDCVTMPWDMMLAITSSYQSYLVWAELAGLSVLEEP